MRSPKTWAHFSVVYRKMANDVIIFKFCHCLQINTVARKLNSSNINRARHCSRCVHARSYLHKIALVESQTCVIAERVACLNLWTLVRGRRRTASVYRSRVPLPRTAPAYCSRVPLPCAQNFTLSCNYYRQKSTLYSLFLFDNQTHTTVCTSLLKNSHVARKMRHLF